MLKHVARLLLLFASSTCALAQGSPQHNCTPEFPYKQQWMGADAAYSIPLGDGRDVWIFGDTLYGDRRVVTGDDPRMVHNSIGVSTCNGSHWNVHYALRHDAKREPTSFFAPKTGPTYYWALAGARDGQDLWISLLCVRNSPKKPDAGALGFETCGTDLARVETSSAAPEKWKVSYFPLVPESVHANPSASALIRNGYLYFYTLYEKGSRPTILVRLKLSDMQDPKNALEYLASDGHWQKGLEPEKAKIVMQHGASEMSVNYHPELKKWVAVLVDPTMFSDKVLLRTSPSMEGPWTDGEVIYRIPEMQKNSSQYDPDTFCYAGKEHPEFERGDLVFTYVCNTMKPKKLETKPEIYHPIAIRMKMPEAAQK